MHICAGARPPSSRAWDHLVATLLLCARCRSAAGRRRLLQRESRPTVAPRARDRLAAALGLGAKKPSVASSWRRRLEDTTLRATARSACSNPMRKLGADCHKAYQHGEHPGKPSPACPVGVGLAVKVLRHVAATYLFSADASNLAHEPGHILHDESCKPRDVGRPRGRQMQNVFEGGDLRTKSLNGRHVTCAERIQPLRILEE
mmetsp:Transcript_44655/g.123774  ORF Transcript_44655/g.123774 Transcript_44655/m.123774 type:complete len:203 (+) Transcript_44655:302-910(+)